MNPIQTIRKLFTPQSISKDVSDEQEHSWWNAIGGSSIYSSWKHDKYENAYPSISKINNRFMVIEPFAMDVNGKRVKRNAVEKLFSPNTDMDAVGFREALSLLALTHDTFYIRVHHKDTNLSRGIREDRITGYTFLEGVNPVLVDKKKHYYLQNGDILTSDEVMEIRVSHDPNNLAAGYSALRAGRKWIRIDDYIADYQAGFFKNGAVPAGMFKIVAKTRQDFLDIKKAMQDKHRGAGKNNNVVYSWAPTDQEGKALPGQIEWIPFNVQNKDMALADIFKQANDKIDSNFGVPASIRAVNNNNTYASVRVDQLVMTQETVRPHTMKIWGRFTHELARVCHGIDFAISYELPDPTLADEELVIAQKQEKQATVITNLSTAGYELSSIIAALKKDDFSLLVEKPVADEEDIITPEDLKDQPDPIDNVYKDASGNTIVVKYNPYRGSDGRFADGPGGADAGSGGAGGSTSAGSGGSMSQGELEGSLSKMSYKDDAAMALVYEQKGFDAKPQIVSSDSLGSVAGTPLYRGDSAAHKQDFRYGEKHFATSEGIYGGGTYFSDNPGIASAYNTVSGHNVMAGKLAPDARIITSSSAMKRAEADGFGALTNPGIWAAANGYDAIKVNNSYDFDQYVVLNRGKMTIGADDVDSTVVRL